tara:strand:- start:1176 stop:1796 length:621 start_codon:yes stop_codon:yes gene_type:complete
MKDYRVRVQIRNERLLSAIEKMGFKSVSKFCKTYEIDYQRATSIVNGSLKPFGIKGDINITLKNMLNCLELNVEDAFTPRQLKGFNKHSFQFKVNENELKKLVDPIKNHEVKLIEGQVTKKLSNIFSRELNPRAERILRMMFGIGMKDNTTHTLEEAGLEFNITRERVRQVLLQSIAKLKKSHVIKELIECGAYEVISTIGKEKND